MLIKEVCIISKLTKKAVEYYEEQGLVSPKVLENGYRDFSSGDIEQLKKIAILRKLELGIDDIKIVLSDGSGQALQKLSIQKELKLQREKEKQLLLDKLSIGIGWDEINAELKAIERNETITERLLDAFPGYYGWFISMHFSSFINEPLTTPQQQEAYDEIVSFLDNATLFGFSKELQELFIENTRHIGAQNIRQMTESTKKSIENPEKFLSENKEILDRYLAYKKSDEYKNSPSYKIQSMLKEFNSTSGYYDIFIPAMKKLSASYANYYKQLDIANGKLLSKYPEIKKMSD